MVRDTRITIHLINTPKNNFETEITDLKFTPVRNGIDFAPDRRIIRNIIS